MSQLKTNAIRHTTATSDAITLASDGTATAKITNNLSNRNIIINGAMRVAQRGSSSTSTGLKTVDRMTWGLSGHSVTVTQTKHALTSSDTGPWEKGFRNSCHIGLSAAGTMAANTTMSMFYKVEAQDIANSGWDYTSASSYITLSFWFKASTAQTFYLLLFTNDGTSKSIVKAFTPGNTNWNKFTFKIPGASGVEFDNNNGAGLDIGIVATYGTDKTGSGNNLDAWGNYNSSERVPDMASTWLTAGASTFEFTGLQLEVGDVASDYEHLSYQDDLLRCQRYYTSGGGSDGGTTYPSSDGYARGYHDFKVQMRSQPTMTFSDGGTGGSKVGDSISNRGFFVTYGSLAASGAGSYNWTASAEL